MDVNKFLDENIVHTTDTKVTVEQHLDTLFTYPDETVSQEGFTDVLRRFWEWVIEPGKPGVGELMGGWFKDREVIAKAMQRTYLNPEWLDKRIVREGTVLNLDRSYDAIGVNGLILKRDLEEPIQDLLEKTRKVADGYSRYLRLVDMELQSIMRKVNVPVAEINLFHVEEITNRLESSAVRLSVGYRTLFGNTDVNRVVTPAIDSDKPFNADKLKEYKTTALTAEEVVICCNAILSISEGLDIVADVRRDFHQMKGFKAVAALHTQTDRWIAEQRQQARMATQTHGQTTDPYVEPQLRLLDLLNSVCGIPVRMIRFHQQQINNLMYAYARLIDSSVK